MNLLALCTTFVEFIAFAANTDKENAIMNDNLTLAIY
jgi:hypothetical protein